VTEALGPSEAENAAPGFDAPCKGATPWGGRESKSLQVSRRQIAAPLGVGGPSGSSSLKQPAGSEGATSVVCNGFVRRLQSAESESIPPED